MHSSHLSQFPAGRTLAVRTARSAPVALAVGLALALGGCSETPSGVAPQDAAYSLGSNGRSAPEFTGRFVLRFAEDLERETVETTDMLELDDGSMLELKFRGRRPEIVPGARIRVRGERKGRGLEVADGSTVVEAGAPAEGELVAADGGTSVVVSPTRRRVAIVLFNFSNNTSQPYTPAHAAGIAFTNTNSVAAYYRSNSWNSVELVGDVFGWFTISHENTSCNYSTWGSAANTAAAAAGIDLSSASYEHVVYAFPATSACNWSGMGNLPGRLSYLNGSGMSLRTMAHELGHNFGTHHASTYSCTEGGVRVSLSATATNCTRGEYGDPFSIMGASTRRHTNQSLTNFAWLPAPNRLDVTQSGDYLLAPVLSGQGTQLIRVQRSSTSFLTLEFREAAAPFDAFSSSDPVVSGVSIRLTGTGRSQSLLIDATPSTSGFSDAALAVGRTFVDPETGVSITTLSVSSEGAMVRISFVPDTSPPTQPGSLTARALDPNRIALSWTASTDNTGVAGYRIFRAGALVATVTGTTFTDTGLSPSTSYGYQVVAYDAAGNTSTTASASATTPAADTTPPTAPTNLTATVSKRNVTLSWTASTDDVGVAGYRVFRDGALLATVTGTTHGTSLPGGKNASASFHVVAFDAAGNVSPASNTVVVRS